MVRAAFYADEGEVRALVELLGEGGLGDQVWTDAWEMGVEEVEEGGGRGGFQSVEPGCWREEDAVEGLVWAGERAKHVFASRPDVEVVGAQTEGVGFFGGRDAQFAPDCVGVLLLVVQGGVAHYLLSGGGVGAVGADEEVERDFFWCW